jgi:hypothetical protein
MKEIKCKLIKNIDIVLLFVVCVSIFSHIILHLISDITVHIDQVVKINSSEIPYPPNFLFYFTINFLSAFSNNLSFLNTVTILLLSLAAVAKYAISKNIIIRLTGEISDEGSKKKICIIALGLFFFFAIPDPYTVFVLDKMYLGRLVPIVWHNSTVIMLFPFAVLLYWKQLQLFDLSYKATTKDIVIINILVILNILIKPSFVFVYIPITFFFLLNRFKVEGLKAFVFYLSPMIIGGLFIIGQYYLIYKLQQGSFDPEASGIAISSPFEVTLLWIPKWYLPISFLLSFCLPIFTVFLFKDILKYKPFVYALALSITGVFISAFIMETGPRMTHGNFTWQNIICTFLLMLATVSYLTPKFLNVKQESKKVKFLLGLFIIHVLSGILYLINYAETHVYY